MTLTQMQDALGIEKIPPSFENIYETVKDSFLDRAHQILSSDYIRKILRESGAMLPYEDLIVDAAEKLQDNPAAMLLICLLEKWILDLDGFVASDYTPPTVQGFGFDFLHLFVALPSIPETLAHLRSRGVPEDVIAATMKEYDFCLELRQKHTGKPSFDYGRLKWMRWMIHNKLIIVGNLKFDFFRDRAPREACLYESAEGKQILLANNVWVHSSGGVLESAGLEDAAGSFHATIIEEADTITGHPIYEGVIQKTPVCLERSKWKCVLEERDPVVCVHIPFGAGLDHDLVAASYDRARKIFAKCYPDLSYKGFYTHTWLLSPQLRDHLKPTSNILAFQRDYQLFPCKSKGQFVFSFVFGRRPENLQDLPEDSSLQRSLKKLYLDGGFIHEYCGVFL